MVSWRCPTTTRTVARTVHQEGDIALQDDDSIGTGKLTLSVGTPAVRILGGTRTLANDIDVATNVIFFGGSPLIANGAVELQGADRTLQVQGAGTAVTINGAVTSASNEGLVKEGAEPLTLAGVNTYGGDTVVGNGTLFAGSSTAIPTNSIVEVGSLGTLDLNGNDLSVGSLTGGAGATIALGANTPDLWQ